LPGLVCADIIKKSWYWIALDLLSIVENIAVIKGKRKILNSSKETNTNKSFHADRYAASELVVIDLLLHYVS
jgi:hypothetical protein